MRRKQRDEAEAETRERERETEMRRKDLNLSRGNASFRANFPPDRGCSTYQTWLVRVESAYDSNHASRKRRDEIRFIREASTRRNGCPRKGRFRNKR